MSELFVWYFIPDNCFVLSTSKNWTKRNFSLFSETTYWNGPDAIAKHQFIFLGEL